jgi:hypothetical protein
VKLVYFSVEIIVFIGFTFVQAPVPYSLHAIFILRYRYEEVGQ